MLYWCIWSYICNIWYFENALQFCESNRTYDHLELYAWNYCTYKVYPVTGFDKYNQIPCQCRSLDIDRNATLNIPLNSSIIEDIFSNWFMLENVRIIGAVTTHQLDININFTKEMFSSKSMRAIHLSEIHVDYVDSSISNWGE